MTKSEKKYLLELSRRTLEKYLKEKTILAIDEESLVFPLLKEKKGVFITLYKDNQLRGCIGNLYSEKPIFESIIENTLASALFDPRFPPLEEDELENIKISISVLTEPKPLPQFKDIKELLNYLKKKKPGLVIKKGESEATFLPQVWKELKNPEEFLTHLCLKAGLNPQSWKNSDLTFLEYEVEEIQEGKI